MLDLPKQRVGTTDNITVIVGGIWFQTLPKGECEGDGIVGVP